MSDSNIEWTDATWNPVVGCARVSPGCEHCYAERQAFRIEKMGQTPRYKGLTVVGKHGPRWSGEARTAPEVLEAPLRWRKPRLVFVNSMSDLFHEDVPFEYIAAVFGVMAACPQHTFQVLTKRAERMVEWFKWIRYAYGEARNTPAEGCRHEALSRIEHRRADGSALPGPTRALFGYDTRWPLPNVHLGVSVEDQRRADERIPLLLQCPAAVRWVSAEPLLGPVDLTVVQHKSVGRDALRVHVSREQDWQGIGERHLDWVVVGGESGPGARPFDIAWARSIVGQCKAASVPVFVKQMGAAPFDSAATIDVDLGSMTALAGNTLKLGDKKGGNPAEWPDDLRVREWPEARR